MGSSVKLKHMIECLRIKASEVQCRIQCLLLFLDIASAASFIKTKVRQS